MPLQKLQFQPGVNRDQTNYSNEGGWYECDKIRFRSGYPQKLGGWQKYTLNPFIGITRQLWNWITSYTDNFLAIGTNIKLYIEAGSNIYDITPLQGNATTGDVTFAATNGSNVITVTDVTVTKVYVIEAGNYVTFSNAVGLGGNITADVLNQDYEIATVNTTSEYTIVATATANASDVGDGGAGVDAAYQIAVGYPIATAGYGWGTGEWGGASPPRGWGTGSTQPLYLAQRDWWFDNFENDLIANIRNGQIYYWERGLQPDPSAALTTPAILLSDLPGAADVPVQAMQVLVSQNDKHLLAFGCVPYGSVSVADFDPLLIRWASQNAPEFWTPGNITVPSTGTLSSAGFIRVSRGSYIVRALPVRQEILVFTNSNLFSLQFTGTTDIFALQELADNMSIMSPRACISASNVTYWMGQDKFYAYSGRVETLPCTLRNHVFQNLNYDQAAQVVCGTNEGWNEVWWFYPSSGSLTNDSYVVYNYLEKVWYYGSIERTAWLDTALRAYPQAAGGQYIYNHEVGVDADGAPMASRIVSSDFDLVDGDQFVLIKRIIPDINFQGSTVDHPQVLMTVKPRNFPGSNYIGANEPTVDLSTTVPVEQYTEQVFIRSRARQMGFKIESVDLGVQWQLGSPRLDGRPDGKR